MLSVAVLPAPRSLEVTAVVTLVFRPAVVAVTLTEKMQALEGASEAFAMVMTPLVTDDGWIVYVNRGFVPESNIDAATRAGGQIAGHTTVVGLLRGPADRAWFMPGDDATKNVWTSRDPKLYAVAQGYPAAKVAPYIVDARFDPALPLPQGGETVVSFPNNHLGYAMTWFGLAASCAIVYLAFAVTRLRGRVG